MWLFIVSTLIYMYQGCTFLLLSELIYRDADLVFFSQMCKLRPLQSSVNVVIFYAFYVLLVTYWCINNFTASVYHDQHGEIFFTLIWAWRTTMDFWLCSSSSRWTLCFARTPTQSASPLCQPLWSWMTQFCGPATLEKGTAVTLTPDPLMSTPFTGENINRICGWVCWNCVIKLRVSMGTSPH